MSFSRRAFVVLLTGAIAACGSAHSQRPSGTKEESNLLRSAEIYWQAVRWSDGERASVFIENPAQRVLYKEWLDRQMESRRYEEVTVIQAVLGPELEKEENGRTREAVLFIRARGYELPEQILQTWRVRQTWYRTPMGWFVEWEDPNGGFETFESETAASAE